MKKTFIREIPKSKLIEAEINRLKELGFLLIDKDESVEVWVEQEAS